MSVLDAVYGREREGCLAGLHLLQVVLINGGEGGLDCVCTLTFLCCHGWLLLLPLLC